MYESFFGLTGPPFRLVPDPSCLFVGKGHRDASAALQVGLAAGARVVVLTGDVGAGKTTLLQALLAGIDPTVTMTVHISAAHLDAATLCERLSEALGLPQEADPLARRVGLLTALPTRQLTTLLAIDEAQHLAPSALDLLEAFASATALAPARLQICLVGQPELRILLNAAQRGSLRELIDVDRHLGPLERAEIRLYVEHRLHCAGWAGRPEFEDAAFTEIFIFTAGNPRRVNLLCNSLMLCAFLKKQQRIDAPAVTWAAAAMREDSFQGAPDPIDLRSHFERRLTLTEVFDPDTELETTTRRQDTPPWSCQSCGGLNASTAPQCWNCEAARPSLDAAADSPGATIHAAEDAMTAPPDAVHVAAAPSTHAADKPAPLALSDGTPHEVETVRYDPSAGTIREEVSASRRRRQAVLASVATVAVALALLAYLVDQEGSHPDSSQNIVSNRTTSTISPPTGPDPLRRGVGSVAPESSVQASAAARSPDLASRARAIEAAAVKVPQDGDTGHGSVAGEVPDAAGTTTPRCSDPAFALGLCDAGSPSERRQ